MSSFWKNLLREIKNTYGRFLSLIIITALGAASVVGIQAASIDMRDVADKMYKEHALYDLHLKSATGFSEEDISALAALPLVSEVMPGYIFDVFLNNGGRSSEERVHAVRLYSVPESLNRVDLMDGRLPQNAGECVVERNLLAEEGYRIGDAITLSLDDMDTYRSFIASETFVITGVVSSPLYVSMDRGSTSLGDGSLGFYIYLDESAFIPGFYTDIYLQMAGSMDLDNLSGAYSAAAEDWVRQAEAAGTARVDRQKAAISEAYAEIDRGRTELAEARAELEREISEGKAALDEGRAALNLSKEDLDRAEEELLQSSLSAEEEINAERAALTDDLAETALKEEAASEILAELDAAETELNNALSSLYLLGEEGSSPELDALYAQINGGLVRLSAERAALRAEGALLSSARRQIEIGLAQLDIAEDRRLSEQANGQDKIAQGRVEYDKALRELDGKARETELAEQEGIADLNSAELELDESERLLDNAPVPEWFYFTREDGVAFESYYQDTLRLQKIGYVFPLVFFLVAILVSLTTMSRMVDEQRVQMGVFKALGYRSFAIISKYLLYAFTASFTGGVGGIFLGSWMFPEVITNAYGYLYNMPPVAMPVPPVIAAVAVGSAVLAVVLVTFFTALAAIKGSPAGLLRPKVPIRGKRVLVERLGFLWRRLGFLGKVTARNIFRYKKRFLMTLAGVAGCTALLLTAFGLRDSIAGVASRQFGGIVRYEARLYLKDISAEEQKSGINALLPGKRLYISESAVSVENKTDTLSASLFVPESAELLPDFLRLYAPGGADINLYDGSVILTDKLARELSLSIGDNFVLRSEGGTAHEAVVTGIADNYVLHYVYMSAPTYTRIFGDAAPLNSVLSLSSPGADFDLTALKNENVRAVVHTSDLLADLSDSTDALSIVIVVLLFLACALATVVLFNLTNINVAERIRELATIKVLGFYNRELAMYIYRENAWVTAMGIIIGLFLGVSLNRFVLTSAEIDLLKFPLFIRPLSFVLAAALSAVFALAVNGIMLFKFTKIDMVESLKSVE